MGRAPAGLAMLLTGANEAPDRPDPGAHCAWRCPNRIDSDCSIDKRERPNADHRDARCQEDPDRRRHHRVQARQRAPGAAVPRPDAVDGDGQHHVPRRLAPRGLRRDRHGAPARAHDVQGLADASQRAEAARREGRPAQRHDVARSHELLRDAAGLAREPRLDARRSRPIACATRRSRRTT